MKILVVEDNQAVAQTLQLLLTGYNYTVDLASDGQVGLEMAEASRYDLMLLDFMLPKLDGIHLCQQLRAKGIGCPILLLTGQDSNQQKTIALQAGADDYLIKPFHAEALIHQIQKLLQKDHASKAQNRKTTQSPLDNQHHSPEAPIDGSQGSDRLNQPKIDEIKAIQEELRSTQAQLQVTQATLHKTQQELAIAYHTIEQERQQLHSSQHKLEQRFTEQTAELRQREALLRSIYEGAEQAVFVVDRIDQDFRYVSFNPLAEQYAGLRGQDIHNKTPEEAFGPTIGASFRQHYTQCLESGNSLSYEEQVVFEDRVIWTLTTLSPLRNEQGEIYRLVGTCIDISDRKQAELEIRKFAALADSSSDFIGMCDLNFVPFYINPAGKELMGLANLEQYQNAPVREFFFPEDQDFIIHDFFPRILQEGKAEVEVRFRHFQTSEALWMLYNVIRIQDDQGQPIAFATISRNITQRKQSEELSKSNQAKFEALVRNMPGVVYRYFPHTPDQPHHFTFVSSHSYELFEVAPEVLLKDINAFLNLIHPEDLPSFFASVNHCVEYFLPWHWEGRIITPSGKLKWIQGTSQAQHTTEGEAWDGLLVDISDRKLAEQKMQEQAALLDIASDAIFVRDLNNRILYWNQGAERLYGWKANEAIGQLADQLLQDPNSSIDQILPRLLQSGEWRGEIQNLTKAGKPVTVEARWTLVRDEGGEPQSILTVDTDITEKKLLETQFYRAQRLESLGTLASGIAHDLNNVLTPILAISQLLRLKQPNLDSRSQEMLQVLEDSAKRGAAMIKQILTFTRGTGGDRSPVLVNTVLQEVISIIQQTFPSAITICHSIPAQPLWYVSADSTYLHQILMNLCVNARDAMPDGGVLSLAIERCYIDQAFTEMNLDAHVGNYVKITVSDTGSGIPTSIRDHIFEPFFTTKVQGQGTGLGLASALGIVKHYGGFLEVWSEVGQGTHMTVFLPLLEGVSSSSSPAEQSLDSNQAVILVVDDDVAVQQSTQALLESHHYTVLSSNRGTQAIALYQQYQVDIRVVLLDIMMPEMSGTTLIQHLRAISPTIQIIAMSGLLTHRESALAAGANLFLAKPYSLEDMLAALQTLIHPAQ